MQDGTSNSELRARQSPLQGELDTVKATAKPRFTGLTFYSIQEAINRWSAIVVAEHVTEHVAPP